MTSSTNDRYKWKRVNGLWTKSIGPRGSRIRLFEKTKEGYYYCDFYTNGKNVRTSLKTRNRAEAEEKGKQLLSQFLSGAIEEESGVLTLGTLWMRYESECTDWLDNSEPSKKDDRRSAKILIAHFGENRDVAALTKTEQTGFATARENGGIKLPDDSITSPVRMRTVQADLVLLHTMLRWASGFRTANGKFLLASNPLDRVKIPREKNAARPIASLERFEHTRRGISKALAVCKSDSARAHWEKLDLALVLSEATGRRIGSISQLRWEDFDFDNGAIRWSAESDKMDKEADPPMGKKLRAYLKRFQKRRGVIGGWVFPSSKNPAVSMDRWQFDYWLRKAEKLAGVPKLIRGLWHPYRRKWATERKDLPIKDVMAVGGWSDTETFLASYQQSDRATQLRVMDHPKKYSEVMRLRKTS